MALVDLTATGDDNLLAGQVEDLLAKTPGELGGAGGAAPDIDGGYNGWEGYAEIVAPRIQDKPFFNSLTLEAGARYSKYSINNGGSSDTWTWKGGLSWEPTADLKLRANYARAAKHPAQKLYQRLQRGAGGCRQPADQR